MAGKEGGKSHKRRSNEAKNIAILDHLVCSVMAVEEDDPMDKILKNKNYTIRKLSNLINLSHLNFGFLC